MEASAIYTVANMKKKRTAALFSIAVFSSCAAALLDKLKAVHEKACTTGESTFEQTLSAQMARRRSCTLSVRAMLLRTMNMFSHDSDRRVVLTVCAEGGYQDLVSVMSTHLLLQSKMVVLGKKKDGSPLAMTPSDSARLT